MALSKTKNIVITGSQNWQDRTKLKTAIFHLKEKFGKGLRIISCGSKYGADQYVKKFSLYFDLQYAEFPTYDNPWNSYCIKPPYFYGKSRSDRYKGMRDAALAKEADTLIVFAMDNDEYKPYENLINVFQKKHKEVLVIK